MGFFDNWDRSRQTGASFRAKVDHCERENSNRKKDGPKIDSDTLAVHVVLDNAAVRGVYEANYQIEKTQERPGKSLRSMGLVGNVRDDGKYHKHKCGDAQSEVKSAVTRH